MSKGILAIGLVLSLLFNIYLWKQLQQADQTTSRSQPQVPSTVNELPSSHSSQSPLSPELDNDRTQSPQAESTTASNTETKNDDLASFIQHFESALANETLSDGQLQLLQRYLRDYPNHIELLLLEAKWIAQTEPMSVVIEHYAELLNSPLTEAQYKDIQDTIEGYIETSIENLKSAMAWDALAQFLEPLYQLYPTRREFILGLAEAYAKQAMYTLMEDVLASLPFNDRGAQRIRQLANVNTPAGDNDSDTSSQTESSQSRQGTAVALQRIRHQYLVDTQFNRRSTRLLLDTGASTTTITHQVYQELKAAGVTQFLGIFTVTTASDTVQAPMIKVDTFRIGPYTMHDTVVMVMPDGLLANAQGLLGMNVLSKFNFQLDQSNSRLYLSPR